MLLKFMPVKIQGMERPSYTVKPVDVDTRTPAKV